MRSAQKGFTAIEALITMVVIAVVAFSGYWVWHHHNKKEVGPNGLTQAQQLQVEKSALSNIKYQLYSYQTTARIYSRSVSAFYKPNSYLNGDNPNYQYDNSKYAHLVEVYGVGSTLLTVNQFNSTLYGGGPATCTPEDPEFPDYPAYGYKCAQVGVTNLGTPIFAAVSAVDQSYIDLFTTVGSTSISEGIINNKPSWDSVMLNMMKTLKPIKNGDVKFVIPTEEECTFLNNC